MTLGTNQIVTEASVEEAEVNIDKDSIVSLTIQGKKGMKKNWEVKSMEIETLKEAGVEKKKGAMTEIGRAVMSHTEKNLELLTVTSLQTVEQVKKGGVVINQRVRIGVMIKIKLGTEIEKKKKRETGTTRTEAGTTVIKVKANDESTAFLHFFYFICAILFY